MPRLLKNRRKIFYKKKNKRNSLHIPSSNLKQKKTSKEVNLPQISSAYQRKKGGSSSVVGVGVGTTTTKTKQWRLHMSMLAPFTTLPLLSQRRR